MWTVPLQLRPPTFFCDSYSDFDDEAASLIENGINPIAFPNLYVSVTSEESKAINSDPAPKVIISASGMCEAGRIRHHLKHNLWRPECTILFVGYQAVGTLGRAITDGATDLKLFDEKNPYKCGNRAASRHKRSRRQRGLVKVDEKL